MAAVPGPSGIIAVSPRRAPPGNDLLAQDGAAASCLAGLGHGSAPFEADDLARSVATDDDRAPAAPRGVADHMASPVSALHLGILARPFVHALHHAGPVFRAEDLVPRTPRQGVAADGADTVLATPRALRRAGAGARGTQGAVVTRAPVAPGAFALGRHPSIRRSGLASTCLEETHHVRAAAGDGEQPHGDRPDARVDGISHR